MSQNPDLIEDQPETMDLTPQWHIYRDAEGKPDIQAARDALYAEFAKHEVGHLALMLENAIQTTGEYFREIIKEIQADETSA